MCVWNFTVPDDTDVNMRDSVGEHVVAWLSKNTIIGIHLFDFVFFNGSNIVH